MRMTREQVLINHIQEYLDSGMWQYEACYLNKDDLKVIIKALEQETVLDKIKAEIVSLTYYWCEVNPKSVKEDVLEIIDKYRESEVVE